MLWIENVLFSMYFLVFLNPLTKPLTIHLKTIRVFQSLTGLKNLVNLRLERAKDLGADLGELRGLQG